MDAVKFSEIEAPTPTYDDLKVEHDAILVDLENADSAEGQIEAIDRWDRLRREFDTWTSLVHLRFNQDTRNDEYKRAREYCDELKPKITELDIRLKRALLASEYRSQLEERFGPVAFALWDCDVTTYDPAIEQEKVRESNLEAEYTELQAAAEFEFQGEKVNLSSILKFREHPDREIRHQAEQVRWGWFAEKGKVLDRIYDDLVRLRTKMARKLGFESFTELGYKRMQRIDYNRNDVETFRAAVHEHVVPLAVEIRKQQAAKLGVEKLMFWDDAIFDPSGNPAPKGDHDWMIERAVEMFDEIGGGLDSFFRMMVDSNLMDLKTRDGKAGGGFCTTFASYGVPYIYANFNGSKGDVEVFTHEMGHAFQVYQSRNLPLADYLWPTTEACEIHSMSLEYLTWPQMEKFFGDDAERFRKLHLTQSLLFFTYGVAIDHFQHLVYASPEASPDERHGMWRQIEEMYLPWRDYGDLSWPAKGGFWQFQRHIYLVPFYYIDYTLAEACALQFWRRSEEDFGEALTSYVALCQRGGEASFRDLCKSAGLKSPFEPDCLKEVVEHARGVMEA